MRTKESKLNRRGGNMECRIFCSGGLEWWTDMLSF